MNGTPVMESAVDFGAVYVTVADVFLHLIYPHARSYAKRLVIFYVVNVRDA